jgi:hypothetical protein
MQRGRSFQLRSGVVILERSEGFFFHLLSYSPVHLFYCGVRDLLIPAVIPSAAKNPFFSGLLPLFSGLLAKTNPIFSRPNMRYQYQKRRNGDQKMTQKNETNPIVDNFLCGRHGK